MADEKGSRHMRALRSASAGVLWVVLALSNCVSLLHADSGDTARFRVDRDFSVLDEAVRALPKADSIADTVAQLESLAADDWERARAVYVWLTDNIAYDVSAYFSGRRATTDPEGVFRTGASVCQGYADLARRLGTGLGLEVATVSGYAKGYGYREGRRFGGTNHAWNAVRIDGAWHLFDATWGAGYVNGRRYYRSYAEFWFDPDPVLFGLTHLPVQSAAQLVDPPVSMEEYVARPYLAASVFEHLHDAGFDDAEILAMESSLHGMDFNPHDFEDLREIGFSTDRILEAVTSGVGIPRVSSFDGYDITVVEAPLRAVLPVDEEVKVVVHAPGVAKGAWINNGGFTFLKQDGEHLVGSIAPVRGELRMSLRINHNGRTSYWRVLEYDVR